MVPVETFPALTALAGIRHAFTLRQPNLDVKTDRATALQRLDQSHAQARRERIGDSVSLITVRQIHGSNVAVVDDQTSGCVNDFADGVITNAPNICLGIYVADCCAVYLVDPVRRAIGLLHSGKKGTELGIAVQAIAAMKKTFNSSQRDLVVQLGPCIRPPHYEVDFAADIAAQCRGCGVEQIFDCGQNTGSDLQRFYSYRLELGRTGRMLALLALIS